MFADDTSILVSHTNYDDFMKVFDLVMLHISKWFQSNQVTLNVEKTSIVILRWVIQKNSLLSILRFTPIKFSHFPVNWAYADQAVTEFDTLKYLGLLLDKHLTWKSHIDFLLCKLGTSSHLLGIDAIKTAYCSNSHSLFKTAYCSNSHSLFKYGFIFWVNLTNISKIFLLQKRIIRIIMGVNVRCSSRGLLKKLDIVSASCEHISYFLWWCLLLMILINLRLTLLCMA